jgi:poly-gamma-glutamate synthesis protein (capsule biosynthesis protein)
MASKDQVRLAHFMLDNGADMVVGGHPHVTQNIEIYKNKPIFYSLGNFVFNGFEDEDTNTGWALELVIGKAGQIGWQVHVAKLDKNGIPHRAGSLPPVRLPRP